ncbi:MAG: transaldolase family protein [Burkholderiaceae bacterium]
MPALLEQLKRFTTIVADGGDIAAIARDRPRDATTDVSQILRAARMPRYAPLARAAAPRARSEPADRLLDRVLVAFGVEILKRIDGRVSTDVDARLSFDTRATIERARRLIALYESHDVARDRVLVKVVATWEGIRAAELLEREDIRCDLTLVFSTVQAQAAADSGVTRISAFVGRVRERHAGAGARADEAAGADDPGVRSVRAIYALLKGGGYPTEIMGANLRTMDQIVALAGCDSLAIGPELLERLAATEGRLERAIVPPVPSARRTPFAEPAFRYALNDEATATEALAEGIRILAADAAELQRLVAERAAEPAAQC